jgi:pyruvate dehydrogenase E2 component (dihydrolipoamide acetyltransferase)
MAVEVTLPRQGWSMEEAAFVEWLKKDGDAVKSGDPLFSVETDKTVQEIESLDDGVLRIPPDGPRKGDMVHVGAVVGYLVQPGETIPFDKPQTAREDARPPKSAPSSAQMKGETPPRPPTVESAPQTVCPPSSVLRSPPSDPRPSALASSGGTRPAAPVSPRAARKALQQGVDLRGVKGSGAGGRIRERDVIAAPRGAATKPFAAQASMPPLPRSAGPLPEGRDVPLSGLRRTIAQRMVASKTLTAPVTLTTKTNATALVSLREKFKVFATPDEPAPSYNDMVLLLVAAVLKEHPMLNAQWADDRIVVPSAINIGLAVDTPDGLLVPVVHDVPSLSLKQMAVRTSDLIARARSRAVTTEEMTGGTFTVSNLGGMGIDGFTPIINHPECAVLGLGRIFREPTIEGGQLVLRSYIWLSLTFDHRIVDGASAARFLESVRRAIENPATRLAL